MKRQEFNEVMKSSWLLLFLTTGICFLLFGLLLKFITEDYTYLFVNVGLINIAIAVACFFEKLKSIRNTKKNSQKRVSIFEED